METILSTRSADCKLALQGYIAQLRAGGIDVELAETGPQGVEFEFEFEFEDAGGSVMVTLADINPLPQGEEESADDYWDRDDFSETTPANETTRVRLPAFVLQRIWRTIQLLASEEEAAAAFLTLEGSPQSLQS